MSKRKSTAKAILSNLHALRERRYVGDLDASDTLIDFERALTLAKLTKRQSEAIRLVYDVGLTQKQAAAEMGVGQEVVNEHLRKATEELDEVYEYWAWLDGELTPEMFTDDEIYSEVVA
ncbi:sigma factor-like helix-turn-helix DNA-binding protein [Lysinibacillus fusiformis]|uniref:sigma factor-like helix-turn-helix DNA-binding protein n=1 Tax=Lysinibacillus fusiformis TaxID=28031 RepID=UPI00301964B5